MLEVWVRGKYHYATRPTGIETAATLEAAGWEIVWDSAPSDFVAAKYAAQHYGAPIPASEEQALDLAFTLP